MKSSGPLGTGQGGTGARQREEGREESQQAVWSQPSPSRQLLCDLEHSTSLSDGAGIHPASLAGRSHLTTVSRSEKHKESRNQHLPPLIRRERLNVGQKTERTGPSRSFLLQSGVRWRRHRKEQYEGANGTELGDKPNRRCRATTTLTRGPRPPTPPLPRRTTL